MALKILHCKQCGASSFEKIGEVYICPYCGAKYISDVLEVKLKAEKHDLYEADALCDMGYYFEKGMGVQPNKAAAYELYKKAAEAEHAIALNNLGWMKENGWGTDKDIDGAISDLEKAAEMGVTLAMVNLGNIYEDGMRTGEPEYDKALYWYKKAAYLGNIKGAFNYANMYHWGRGCDTDYDFAFSLFAWLNKLGCDGTDFYLGLYYQEGLGVEKDYNKALYYYQCGAGKNDAYCWTQLGTMYGQGQGIEEDIPKAIECYRKAAELGDPLGYTNIAWFYETGTGVEPDMEKALRLYSIAAQLGDETAKEQLERRNE